MTGPRVTWDRGVHLPAWGLWADPETVREVALVSHAHSDHARRHRLALMTPVTHALLPAARRPRQAMLVASGEEAQLRGARIAVHDAGHILGSAMFEISGESASVLYSGDVKLRHPGGRPDTAIPAARVLVLESTYGLPQYRFPDADEVLAALRSWCRSVLKQKAVPVLIANALGKSQELMLALGPLEADFCLHPVTAAWTRGHEACGIRFPSWFELDGAPPGPCVAIVPPQGKRALGALSRYRSALVSGWALDARMRWRLGGEVAFPLSDHCGFDELMEVARRSGAERIYTVHGFTAELASSLRRAGHASAPLRSLEQMELGL